MIEYKRGPENQVADALSRRGIDDESTEYYAISSARPRWFMELESSYEGDVLAEESILQSDAEPYNMSSHIKGH